LDREPLRRAGSPCDSPRAAAARCQPYVAEPPPSQPRGNCRRAGREYALHATAGRGTTQAVWNPLPFDDFQLAIDARIVEPVEDASVFLDFRIHDGSDNGYRFSVDPSGGWFSLQYIRSAGESALIDLTPSPAIHGPAATNRLGVRAQGTAIVLLVNGQEVGRAETSRLREGRIGFGVASPNGEPVEARFSNLLVTSVGD
jgi:hypothetical protein